MVENLSEIADEEENEEGTAPEDDLKIQAKLELPDGQGRSILCIGGRGGLDDAASAMLSQVLEVQGATATMALHSDHAVRGTLALPIDGVDTAIVTFLNGNSNSRARQIVRRLKRLKPTLRVGIFLPAANGQNYAQIDPAEIDADFVATSITQAARSGLSSSTPVSLKSVVHKIARRGSPSSKRVEASI